ncbi:hypothetical protein WJX72_006452 [[Myrmecia] bisecta]|uniref:Uncharacterized protein n=1 Tax=[Myrmecia] bisecta TaxID=41462 RepID=A0AAW1P7A8_9CHLO
MYQHSSVSSRIASTLSGRDLGHGTPEASLHRAVFLQQTRRTPSQRAAGLAAKVTGPSAIDPIPPPNAPPPNAPTPGGMRPPGPVPAPGANEPPVPPVQPGPSPQPRGPPAGAPPPTAPTPPDVSGPDVGGAGTPM